MKPTTNDDLADFNLTLGQVEAIADKHDRLAPRKDTQITIDTPYATSHRDKDWWDALINEGLLTL